MTAAPSPSSNVTDGLDQCPVCCSRLVGLFERHPGLHIVSCENDDCHFTVEAYGATPNDAVRQWNTRDVAQAERRPDGLTADELRAASSGTSSEYLRGYQDAIKWAGEQIASSVSSTDGGTP